MREIKPMRRLSIYYLALNEEEDIIHFWNVEPLFTWINKLLFLDNNWVKSQTTYIDNYGNCEFLITCTKDWLDKIDVNFAEKYPEVFLNSETDPAPAKFGFPEYKPENFGSREV